MAEVSGGHFNPAVSIGLLLGKRISIERFVVYLVAQVRHVWVRATTNTLHVL